MPALTVTTTQQVLGLIGLPSTPVVVDMPSFGGSDDAAVVDGNFCVLKNELSPVLRTTEGIDIVAIHQHMSREQPRYLFLPYWGKGKAVHLAQSLKQVLDARAAVKS